jgi:ATP-dependent RNA helicase SUPV3L1/SUV3
MRDGDALSAHIADDGEVLVEGEYAGRLDGFNFAPAPDLVKDGARALLAAANTALRRDLGERVRRLLADDAGAFALDGQGTVRWRGQRIARLAPGEHVLAPRVVVLPSDLLDPRQRERVRERVEAWTAEHLAAQLAPLFRLQRAELAGPARGIAYELVETLGLCRRVRLADRLAALLRRERGKLQALGVTLGACAIYLPALRKLDPGLRRLLLAIHRGVPPPEMPAPKSGWPPSLPREPSLPAGFAEAGFYLPEGPLLVRADRLEAFAARATALGHEGPFAMSAELAAIIAASPDEAGQVLRALGFRRTAAPEGERFMRPEPRARRPHARRDATKPSSPFAALRDLVRR